MILKPTFAVAFCAVIGLGACTDPATLGTDDPHQKAKQGALAGAILGAGVGLVTAGGNKGKSALIGAAVGAAAGGVIGNELDKQAAELRNELANDGITITNTGDSLIVTLPQDITFATDSSAVRPSLQSDLNKVAAHLNKYPDSSVQVIGNTDNVGDATYNLGLSVQRADAVANILKSGGVAPGRLQVSGNGEEQPVASNLTPEGRALNRRVDIVVIPHSS